MGKAEPLVPGESSAVMVVGAGGTLGGAVLGVFRDSGWKVTAGWHRQRPSEVSSDDFLIRVDALDSASITQGIRDHLDHWGRLDALVYAAGLSINSLLANQSEGDWDRLMRVNLRGAYYCARAAVDAMRQRRRGHIVLVGSFVGRVGGMGQVGYSTSKAALHGLAQELALEAGIDNIQVNVVLPGILESKMTEGISGKVRDAG